MNDGQDDGMNAGTGMMDSVVVAEAADTAFTSIVTASTCFPSGMIFSSIDSSSVQFSTRAFGRHE